MRGQRVCVCVCVLSLRIIPARAGPTIAHRIMIHADTDHPRSCGANSRRAICRTSDVGSSPLVRGQPDVDGGSPIWLRIIPARAGPTDCLVLVISRVTDHPRSCGANITRLYLAPYAHGSSPLVRGQLPSDETTAKTLRIIPARAGPTTPGLAIASTIPDHPRSCGANHDEAFFCVLGDGSSPLVRGQPARESGSRPASRIIPARAGPTHAF